MISVVGARPNFMKIAPVHRAFRKFSDQVTHLICHTGQHFDENMSRVFFEELELPEPDYYLGVGSNTHAKQTAIIMERFEEVLLKEEPDVVLVPGDVNSTLACSLVASKLRIKVGHVEAGLRSFDRNMPEEINRIVTDLVSDFLFVSEPSGMKHLKEMGVPDEKIHFVGNTMIDSLVHYLPKSRESNILNSLDLNGTGYILCTFHRPSNVDSKDSLEELVQMLNKLSAVRKIVYPVHPRTMKNLEMSGLDKEFSRNIRVIDPLGYVDFLHLIENSDLIITDSGGIQEETTYLGIQCITVRDSTERPVTVDEGTNQLIGTDIQKVEIAAMEVINGKAKPGKVPDLWDGKSSDRIVEILVDSLTG